MTPRSPRRDLLEGHTVAAGIYDALSAVLARRAGFPWLFVSGYGLEAGQLGAPDMGMLSMTEVAAQAARIVDAAGAPVICDIDTGFGGVNNIWRTVREMERAGVSAVQIEDQANPKRCPYAGGRKVTSRAEAIGRVRAAADARSTEDFLIVGRSDADVVSFDEVVTRANLFLEAGADIVLPLLKEADGTPLASMSPADRITWYGRLVKEIDGPVAALDPPPGHTAADMHELGYRLVIHTTAAVQAAVGAMARLFATMRETGSAEAYTAAYPPEITADRHLMEILGLDAYLDRESRYSAEHTAL